METLKDRKSKEILTYFTNKEGGKINRMKAMKLIWLSNRLHLREYGRPITNEQYFAMKNGVVPSRILDLSREKNKDGHDVIIGEAANTLVFSKSDIKIMEIIYAAFGDKTQFELSDLSHLYPEWKKHEEHIKAGVSRCMIDEMDFFLDANIENDFFATFNKAKIPYSQELYIEYKNISSL